ncbi:unnamed protein product [Phytophthora fragariaefolia]|uniref:Unnamed protein product n=1 Tax=Phytophthora fragariaefolia TaxID=1490495 RepID=A0A9W6X2C5_9STRA|nr:unnamed protein product [Phytophthora fragariaefolia]
MGNTLKHGRNRDPSVIKMVEKTNKGLYSSPQVTSKGDKKTNACSNQEIKRNPQQQQTSNKKTALSTKRENKKNKCISTEPRKGRKQSFTKFMPHYVHTVPIDDALGGVYDAVEHEDPHGGYYDGKSYVSIDEALLELCDVVEDEAPRGCMNGKDRSVVPIDETLSGLGGTVEDESLAISTQQQQHTSITGNINMSAKPTEKCTRTRPYKPQRITSEAVSIHSNNSRYYGTYDNLYYYDNPDAGHHQDNTGASCNSGASDNECGNIYYNDGICSTTGNNVTDGGIDDSGTCYDAGSSYDVGGGCD